MKERTQSTEKHLTLLRPGPGHHALEKMKTLRFLSGMQRPACKQARRAGHRLREPTAPSPPRENIPQPALHGKPHRKPEGLQDGKTVAGDQTWKEAPFPDPRRTGEDIKGCVLASPQGLSVEPVSRSPPDRVPCPSPGEPGCLDSRWLPAPLRTLRSRTYAAGPELARLSGVLSAGDNAALQAHGFRSAGICSGFCKPVLLPPGARNASSRSELQAGCPRRTQVPVAEGRGPV